MTSAHRCGSDLPPNRLVALARHWAATRGTSRAFAFLGPDNVELEALTYAQLDTAAMRLAALLAREAPAGSRSVLMFPSGLAFVVAFFACHYAGMTPVPVVPARGPRMRDAAMNVIQDCAPDLLLAPSDYLQAARQHLEGMRSPSCRMVAVDFEVVTAGPGTDTFAGALAGADDLAFIQYTSGSTSSPKGVCVSLSNLFANLEMMRVATGNPDGVTYVGWAPLHHDMGLIGNLLAPFYLGGQCVLMSPAQFAGSPGLWLQAISRYRARTSGGPNFAYDLCILHAARILREPLDLSCWEVAFNSGEPVHADTVRRFTEVFAPAGFAPAAMYPAFGMAEATLFVAGASRPRPPVIETIVLSDTPRQLVACGQPAVGSHIAIADPVTCEPCPEAVVGEIWVSGDHIPKRYWQRPDASQRTFHARLAIGADTRRYLRTGDLGVIVRGELFVTGRLKDLMIIRGRNVYPQDVERLATGCAPGLAANACAAFIVDDTLASPRMVIVQEVDRPHRRTIDQDAVAGKIRQAVLREFDCSVHEVALVEPGSIPKTSSGKIRRRSARQAFLDGTLQRIAARPPAQGRPPVDQPTKETA